MTMTDDERTEIRERNRSPRRESTTCSNRYEDEERMKGGSSGGEMNNPGNVLFVANLSLQTRERELLEMFDTIGKVQDCKVIIDPETRESRGFGFVTMESREVADKAMREFHNKELGGKTILVEVSRRGRPRTPTPGRYVGAKRPAMQRERGGDPYERRPSESFDRRGSDFNDRRDGSRVSDRRDDRRMDDRRGDDRRDDRGGRDERRGDYYGSAGGPERGGRRDDRRGGGPYPSAAAPRRGDDYRRYDDRNGDRSSRPLSAGAPAPYDDRRGGDRYHRYDKGGYDRVDRYERTDRPDSHDRGDYDRGNDRGYEQRRERFDDRRDRYDDRRGGYEPAPYAR